MGESIIIIYLVKRKQYMVVHDVDWLKLKKNMCLCVRGQKKKKRGQRSQSTNSAQHDSSSIMTSAESNNLHNNRRPQKLNTHTAAHLKLELLARFPPIEIPLSFAFSMALLGFSSSYNPPIPKSSSVIACSSSSASRPYLMKEEEVHDFRKPGVGPNTAGWCAATATDSSCIKHTNPSSHFILSHTENHTKADVSPGIS